MSKSLTSNKQQSKKWHLYSRLIKVKPYDRLDGFPFDAGFPTMYGGKKYEIITVNREIYQARVDDSREFASEGLEWEAMLKPGVKNFERSAIVAWREMD